MLAERGERLERVGGLSEEGAGRSSRRTARYLDSLGWAYFKAGQARSRARATCSAPPISSRPTPSFRSTTATSSSSSDATTKRLPRGRARSPATATRSIDRVDIDKEDQVRRNKSSARNDLGGPVPGSGPPGRRSFRRSCRSAAACSPPLLKLPAGPRMPRDRRRIRDRPGDDRVPRDFNDHARDVRSRVGGRPAHARALVRGAREAGVGAPGSRGVVRPAGVHLCRATDCRRHCCLPRAISTSREVVPARVLEAVAGVPLDASDLRSVVTGCARHAGRLSRSAGDRRRVARVTGDGNDEIYLRRDQVQPGGVAAGVHPASWRRRLARGLLEVRSLACRGRFALVGRAADDSILQPRRVVTGRAERRRSAPRRSSCRFPTYAEAHQRRRAPPVASARREMTAGRRRLRFRRSRRSTSIFACCQDGRTATTNCGPTFQSIALADTLTFTRRRAVPFRIVCRRSRLS